MAYYLHYENGKIVGGSRAVCSAEGMECREVTENEYNAYYKDLEEGLTKRKSIAELKQKLAETDYQAIKFAEGEISDEEYEPMKLQRKAWREEINKLEKSL